MRDHITTYKIEQVLTLSRKPGLSFNEIAAIAKVDRKSARNIINLVCDRYRSIDRLLDLVKSGPLIALCLNCAQEYRREINPRDIWHRGKCSACDNVRPTAIYEIYWKKDKTDAAA